MTTYHIMPHGVLYSTVSCHVMLVMLHLDMYSQTARLRFDGFRFQSWLFARILDSGELAILTWCVSEARSACREAAR